MTCPHVPAPDATCFACALAAHALEAPARRIARIAARLERRGVGAEDAARAARALCASPEDRLLERVARWRWKALMRRFPSDLFTSHVAR